jgi:hypothetical protein
MFRMPIIFQCFFSIWQYMLLNVSIVLCHRDKLQEVSNAIIHYTPRHQNVCAFIQEDSTVHFHPRPLNSLMRIHNFNQLLPQRFVRKWRPIVGPPVVLDPIAIPLCDHILDIR